MKPRNEQQNCTEAHSKAGKPRFQIEKLEERIAPSKGGGHSNHPSGGGQNNGSGGHCGHGACKY